MTGDAMKQKDYKPFTQEGLTKVPKDALTAKPPKGNMY